MLNGVVDGLRVRTIAEPATFELNRDFADDGQVMCRDFGFHRGEIAREVLVLDVRAALQVSHDAFHFGESISGRAFREEV